MAPKWNGRGRRGAPASTWSGNLQSARRHHQCGLPGATANRVPRAMAAAPDCVRTLSSSAGKAAAFPAAAFPARIGEPMGDWQLEHRGAASTPLRGALMQPGSAMITHERHDGILGCRHGAHALSHTAGRALAGAACLPPPREPAAGRARCGAGKRCDATPRALAAGRQRVREPRHPQPAGARASTMHPRQRHGSRSVEQWVPTRDTRRSEAPTVALRARGPSAWIGRCTVRSRSY